MLGTLHLGADFRGVGAPVDRTKRWFWQSQLRVLFPLSSRSETTILLCVCHERGQATALPIVTTKSRRFMGVFASDRKTPYHRANSARYCASQQFCPLDFRSGSISATESLLTDPSWRVGLPSESGPYSRPCIGRQLGAKSGCEQLQEN